MKLDDLLITEDYSVLRAMEQLDKTARKILFIQREGRLAGSLSDGDVRRFLLAGGKLEDNIKKAVNTSPKYLSSQETSKAKEYMRRHKIVAVPVVDQNMAVIDILFSDGKDGLQKTGTSLKMPVVIMAGGKGTRLYPYTKVLPKPLIPVADKTIAEHIIKQFTDVGCEDFYMIVNHKKNMIKAYFNELEKDYSLTFVDEEKPLGTGGGLSLLKGMIQETFILTNCDILIRGDFGQMKQLHDEKQNVVTMVCSLKKFPIEYGVVEFGKDGKIQSMKEKPQISFFTNTGCYMVDKKVIDEMETGKSIGFPDIIEKYRERKQQVGVYPINENEWLDMGNLEEMRRMEAEFVRTP